MSGSLDETTCKICRQVYTLAGEEEAENLPHLLYCGHVYCAVCLNLLLVSPSNSITCPDCKMTTFVNGEGLDGLQVDSKTIGLVYTAKIRKGREERQNANTENNTSAVSPQKEKDETLRRALDSALAEAIKKQSELQSAYESLVNGLQSQMTKEKSRLKSEIMEMTKKAVGLVQKRKMTLLAELDQLEHWFSESHAMLQKIEEKKKSIESAIAKAKNLKSPPPQEYCDAEKVLEALLAPVDMQMFDLSCLNKCSGLSCCLDEEKLNQSISITQGNQVNITQGNQVNITQGNQVSITQGNQVNINQVTSAPMESAERISRRPSKSPVDSQSNSSGPKTASSLPTSDLVPGYRWLPNAQSNSGPNVIIEEIIEDSSVGLCPAPVHHTPVQHPPMPKQKDRKKNRPPLLGEPPDIKDKVRLFWVVVSHVVNPGHFYVRYVSEEGTADQLRRVINTFCFGNKGMFSPEDTITKGDTLFAYNSHGGWSRVEVVDVHRSRTADTTEAVRQCRATEVAKLNVFFIDHGFQKTLVIPKEAQHNLSESLRKPDQSARMEIGRWPSQAIRCCLNGIVPAQVRGWSIESINEFRSVTHASAVRMQVFREDKKTLLVDLKKSPMDHANNRMPASLRDHMVYMEFARFYCEVAASATSCKPLQYYPPVSPKPKTEFCAIVSHINTPADFFIQLTENMEFPLLTAKLQALYKEQSEDVCLQLARPMLEQACVAPYEKDMWYRARITGFHGTQMAEVQFVDIGSIQLVPVNNLRVIKDEFLSLPAMAVWCRLADIESDGGYWSDATINRFRDLADRKPVTVVMKKFASAYGPLPLCLFEGEGKRESKSIAHILITEGLAKSPKHLPSVAPEMPSWDPPLPTVEEECKPPGSGDGDTIQLTPSITVPVNQKDIKVRVCQVTSPASIFVQLLQYDRQLKRHVKVFTDTSVFIRGSPISDEDGSITVETCQVDMICAALVQGVWERGKISSILSSKLVEVQCCDYGTKFPVPVDNLRPLPPQLIGSLVLECCLSGIRPAGGAKWTATSCDLISFYLTGATAQMTVKDPPPASPVGVSLLCSNRAGQNVSMADFLISEGLALPERKYRCGFQREASVQELLEAAKAVTAVTAPPAPREDNREGSRDLSRDLSQEEEEDEEEEENAHLVDQAAEVAPTTEDYPPPQPPENLGMTSLTITAVGDDGVIYSMTTQAETDLERLKRRLQQHIKATPMLDHHNWSNVKGCIVKGTDMLWHRGRVVELSGGQVKVQYVDVGLAENIPVCHVYPMVVCADVAQLCVPLRLCRGKPVGKDWHLDAVALMKELLIGRRVDVEIMGLPVEPRECAGVEIFLDGMPVSRIMAQHHPMCINLLALDFEEQNCSQLVDLDDWNLDTKGLIATPPLKGTFPDPALPKTGTRVPVKIKHLCTPDKAYLSINIEREDDVSLEELMECVNADTGSLSHLNDFPIGGPCLAEYSDGSFYRAELIGFVAVSPEIKMLVRHVDFGSDDTVPVDKLRSLPEFLLDIPRRAVCVRLGGFQPPRVCTETKRLPYAPEWSVRALLEMIDLLQKKGIYRALISATDEEIVAYLYSPDGTLVHHSLVKAGLADYEGASISFST